MKIDDYVLKRMRADAAHTIALAECEDAIQHHGLRGRLREILIANLLAPWLPPFCKCATGMIIESRNRPRKSTQDDILVIDPSLAPPILASVDGPDGVFLFNSVLLRIEVKSKITKQGLSDFIDASSEVIKMEFDQPPECSTKFIKPYSILAAFGSDSENYEDWNHEYDRFREVLKSKGDGYPSAVSGFVSAICVANKGLWFLRDFDKGPPAWCRLDTDPLSPDGKVDPLVWLVCKASNTAYRAHVQRQGRDPSQGLEVGIGSCIPTANIIPIKEAE